MGYRGPCLNRTPRGGPGLSALSGGSPTPHDGRGEIVSFTPAGLELLRSGQAGVEAAERRAAEVNGKAVIDERRGQLQRDIAAAGALLIE